MLTSQVPILILFSIYVIRFVIDIRGAGIVCSVAAVQVGRRGKNVQQTRTVHRDGDITEQS